MRRFEPIIVNGGQITPELWNRLNNAIADAINETDAEDLGIVSIAAGDYNPQPTDRFIQADSSGGKIRIVLPNPTAKRFLTIKKMVDIKNSVSVVGKTGSPNIEVFYGDDRSVTVVANGKAWVRQ